MKYPPSILTDNLEECHICKSTSQIEVHHVLHGVNRKNATKYGLVIGLCRMHHAQVHRDNKLDVKLKQWAQKKFEERYGHEKFMEVFRRNYI